MTAESFEVERQDGKVDLDAMRYRWEHFAPPHVGRRFARQIAGRENLRSLDREARLYLGKLVATAIKEFGGIFELALVSNEIEYRHKATGVDPLGQSADTTPSA